MIGVCNCLVYRLRVLILVPESLVFAEHEAPKQVVSMLQS